jgi:hypothetical protein
VPARCHPRHYKDAGRISGLGNPALNFSGLSNTALLLRSGIFQSRQFLVLDAEVIGLVSLLSWLRENEQGISTCYFFSLALVQRLSRNQIDTTSSN